MKSFPNGVEVVVVGSRGKRTINYKFLMFSCKNTPAGHVVEAEFGYRGNFWTLDRWGNVYRVCNGHLLKLCDSAHVIGQF